MSKKSMNQCFYLNPETFKALEWLKEHQHINISSLVREAILIKASSLGYVEEGE